MKRFIFYLFLLCINFGHAYEQKTPSKQLNFFCLDFHGSPSADVKYIFEKLGHKVTHWSIGAYSRFTHGKENDSVDVIDFHSWLNGDVKMYEEFHERHKNYLNEFDAFIVFHSSSLALLYQRFNKPIIVVNSFRYDYPFYDKPELHELLDNFLIERANSNKLFFVANNKADKDYLKFYTQLESEHISSLCLYTNALYRGTKPFFICHQMSNRVCSLSSLVANMFPNLIKNHISIPYRWQKLYNYKGIIHFPYQISTMSIFEQYSANVPLFFPSKEFLLELHEKYPFILSELSSFNSNDIEKCNLSYHSLPPPLLNGDLNNLSLEFLCSH